MQGAGQDVWGPPGYLSLLPQKTSIYLACSPILSSLRDLGGSLGLCLVSSSIPMYDIKVGGAAGSMGSEEQMGQAEFCQTAQAGAPHTLREGSAGKGGILWGSAV